MHNHLPNQHEMTDVTEAPKCLRISKAILKSYHVPGSFLCTIGGVTGRGSLHTTITHTTPTHADLKVNRHTDMCAEGTPHTHTQAHTFEPLRAPAVPGNPLKHPWLWAAGLTSTASSVSVL